MIAAIVTGEAGIEIAGIAIGEAEIAIGEAGIAIATVAAGIESDRRVEVETEIAVTSRGIETSHARGTEIGADLSLRKKIEAETGIEIEIETGTEIRIRKASPETVPRTKTAVGPEIKTSEKRNLEVAIKIVAMRKKRKNVARVEAPAKARRRTTKIAAVAAMTRKKIVKTTPRKGQMRKQLVAMTLALVRRSTSNLSQSRAVVMSNKRALLRLPQPRKQRTKTSRCLLLICCPLARRLR